MSKPKPLVGAICPVCRTVQNWAGDLVLKARIFCIGDRVNGTVHPTTTVDVVSGWQA